MRAWYHAEPTCAALAALAAAGATLVACGSSPPSSGARPKAAATAPLPMRQRPQEPSRNAWPGLAALSRLPALDPEPRPAPGHLDGRHRGVLHVSPEARGPYLAGASEEEFPEGSVVAEFLIDSNTGSQDAVFALRKGPRGFEFARFGGDGTLEAAGVLPLCVRCHAEAPSGLFFGAAH